MTFANDTELKLFITNEEYIQRFHAHKKHGKIKNGIKEYFKSFDRRVYLLGLKKLTEND